MTAVVEIDGLLKTYRRRGRRHRALAGFTMTVEQGQVHGFLGPNGSGKTTTLRALLGLIQADGGAMRMFGRLVPGALPDVVGRVGAVVENPRFFPGFTGRDTLRLLADAGGVPPGRVDAKLELVGLADRARDRVRTYSLGMRQRLAVASALLKDPELVILDEPANGLDPAGIREMRQLMRDLADGGTTVLFSSHLLAEVQQVCDAVTIIAGGRRVAAGPVEDVLASHTEDAVRVRLAAGELAPAAQVLVRAGATVRQEGGHLLVGNVQRPAWVTYVLAEHGLFLEELVPAKVDLESVFLALTGAGPDGPPARAAGGPADRRAGEPEPGSGDRDGDAADRARAEVDA
ncbi:ABC transporter ATP-binding protein [Pilimelia terevasa]|uniref:ABC transporter ATP-binding protein n=1 Tax=Pilimelia terevasa TaxID=53372 RepID=A0A8J3FJJ3_9ACTN|nr:ABC transporter ATP-binding protein [Pilimelia terevasa]GGK29349.1 ABC transporter ATP-binding protein [Pilimelia terevasa]